MSDSSTLSVVVTGGLPGAFLGTLPVAVAAAAQACALFERSRAREPAGSPVASTPVGVLAAGCALFLYPLAVPLDADRRALVLAAGLAGALWLAGRSDEDPRLHPLFLGAAGAIAGARTMLGLALAPFVLAAFFAIVRSRRGARAVAGAVIVFCAGHAAGLLALGRHLAVAPKQSPLLWWSAASQAVGPAALALALAGLGLALTSGTRRAALALVLLLALGSEVLVGQATPISALVLSFGVGLLLVEGGARFAAGADRPGLRGAELALVPLALLALAEPLSARVRATHFTAPTFGPVPPASSRVKLAAKR